MSLFKVEDIVTPGFEIQITVDKDLLQIATLNTISQDKIKGYFVTLNADKIDVLVATLLRAKNELVA